jgi:hypothetical protein
MRAEPAKSKKKVEVHMFSTQNKVQKIKSKRLKLDGVQACDDSSD